MQCITPMFRKYENGQHSKGTIVPRQEVLQGLEFDPNTITNHLDRINSYSRRTNGRYLYEMVPCQHCWACRLNYSAEWATRLTYECQESENNYFITLTYDDNHLPIAETMELGEHKWINIGEEEWAQGTLWPDHMNTFLNSLRKYFERKGHTGIKYFYCGEYGENTHRPHYHIILMNAPLDISKFYDTHIDERWKAHWKSKEIEHYWQHGMIDIAEAEWSSCAYVARYCMKKLHDKNDEEYCKEGKLPEFVRMSKGIGERYYQENKKKIYANDEIIMKTVKGNTGAFKPPKAWDRKFKKEFPDEWWKIERSRKECAERSRQAEKYYSNYSDKERLLQKAEKVIIKGKQLPRLCEQS